MHAATPKRPNERTRADKSHLFIEVRAFAADHPLLTATHDAGNLRSGAVMCACGMTYRHTYHEQLFSKKPVVDLRLCQIDLSPGVRAYRGNWERSPEYRVKEGP